MPCRKALRMHEALFSKTRIHGLQKTNISLAWKRVCSCAKSAYRRSLSNARQSTKANGLPILFRMGSIATCSTLYRRKSPRSSVCRYTSRRSIALRAGHHAYPIANARSDISRYVAPSANPSCSTDIRTRRSALFENEDSWAPEDEHVAGMESFSRRGALCTQPG